MENPTTTPSAAQQAENNGSERMFTQSELKPSLQIGLPVSAPRVPSAWATLTHEKKT